MNLLDQATSGVLIRPQITVLYGPNGVGKTTLACAHPEALIVDLEDGSGFVEGVMRLTSQKVGSLAAVFGLVEELLSSNHKSKTLVIDSLDALESLIHKEICSKHEVESIEEVPYGKGFVMACERMEKLMLKLRGVRDAKSMNIILVGHSQVKTFTDPKANQAYDRYLLRANARLASVVKDLADNVYFINNKVLTKTDKNNLAGKVKAFSTGERTIHTVWSHAYDAKSRYPVPTEIDFSLENIKEAVEALVPKGGDELMHSINQLKARIEDKEKLVKIEAFITSAAGNPVKLKAVETRLKELV